MPKRQVFVSFDYDEDVFRAAQVKNMGVVEGDTIISANEWEEVKKKGDDAIKKWIDDNLEYRSCLVVLIGEKTHQSKWVDYEIKKAWNSGKGVVGVYIHDLKCPKKGTCSKGLNPFDYISMKDGKRLSNYVKTYTPTSSDAYNDISKNIESLIEQAISSRS